jgi:hypothetical protein
MTSGFIKRFHRVAAAYADGSGCSFRPNDPITRQEAAVMLSNILPNYKEKGNLKSYRDYSSLRAGLRLRWRR